MATLTLDNKLYQAYETIAEQNNISVVDAMREALRLLRQHIKKTAKSSTRKRLESRIEELRSLSSNWDYAGAQAISPSVCNHVSEILAACDDKLLEGLAIFPNINGNVLMQWETSKGDACLSILSDKVVYDVNYGEEEKGGSLSFSEVPAFLSILNNIV